MPISGMRYLILNSHWLPLLTSVLACVMIDKRYIFAELNGIRRLSAILFQINMSNDCTSVDTEEYSQDEEVNCVFCGLLFPSIERVQEHIAQIHEAAEPNTEHVEPKQESLRVYDLNTEPIITNVIDYNSVVQCSKCDLLFLNATASRMHFEKVHLGMKRKRSSNPNGVEGIIVSPNGSDNWGCDICGRQFPTLKQAKVHKFKSHIEPLQKNELLIHRDIDRKNNACQWNYVTRMIAENKFREILPNSNKLKIDKSVSEGFPPGNNDDDQEGVGDCGDGGESSCHGDARGSPSGRPTTGNLWRAAQASSRGNKIVISRVYQSEVLIPGSVRTKYGFQQKSGYRCFYCREIFINRESFNRHLLLHREKKCYKCRNCGSKFKRIKNLKQHQRLNCHIEIMDMSCPVELSKALLVKTEPCKPQQKVMKREPVSLSKVESQGAMKVIVTNKEDDISPQDIKFAEKFLNNSSITLNKGSQCVCNLCQSCFYSNNSILRHMVLYHRIAAQDGSTALATRLTPIHPRAKALPSLDSAIDASGQNNKPSLHFIHNCDHCGSQFASKKGLQRHLHSVHMVPLYDPKYSNNGYPTELDCSVCNTSFNDTESFEGHKEDCSSWSSCPSSQSRRVKCDICGRRFRNPMTLEEHKRTHSNGLNLKIEPANGTYVMKVEVKARNNGGGKRAHQYGLPAYKKAKVPPNPEGLFECDVCHKTFTCRSSLSNHVKSHFNFKNKPFSCSACDQGFMSTLTLQHHREQLCPNIANNINNNNNSGGGGGEHNNSGINCSTESVPQVALFSSFEGVSQVPGNSNLTTRATSCMHCSAMFPDRSLLEDHASKEHSNHSGEVVCIICPRSFTTYMAFRVHMTKSHGGPNGTSLKSHLNTSSTILKTTTDVEIIQEHCGSPLGTSNNGQSLPLVPLASLIPLEPLPARFDCPNCDKDFSTSQALGNHKRACMSHFHRNVSV